MKKCPQCNQLFDDVNDFCLNDGTPLYAHSTNPSYDAPTQFMKAPVTHPFQQPSKSASPLLYLVVGVLGTALVAAGAYIYFVNTKDESTPVANKPSEQNTSQQAKQPDAKPTVTTSQSAPPLPTSNVSPAGAWSGDWSGKSSAFTATMSLSETNGVVDGRIVWTLTRSANPQKMYKSGLTAVEYVRGTYDAATRMVKIRGIRKDDPNNLIIYDNYNLSLSEDGTAMSGKSKNGNFRLRR